MKKKILLCFAAVMSLSACKTSNSGDKNSSSTNPDLPPVTDLPDAGNDVTLNISAMHNQSYKMTYVARASGAGPAFPFKPFGEGEGKPTYNVGDFKPVWEQIQKDLNFNIRDLTGSKSSAKSNFDEIFSLNDFTNTVGGTTYDLNILNGNAVDFTDYGVTKGTFVQLDRYFEYLPNLKKFLKENDVVRQSITAGDGHIYFSPYFDGYNQVDRMSMVSVDWVRELLDGAGTFVADDLDKAYSITAPSYQPSMPATLNKVINVTKDKVGGGYEAGTVTKNYSENIITKMNAAITATPKSAEEIVNMLRTHIDTTYNNAYGTARSDLFIGQNAAYDADEMVALLRCVKANSVKLSAIGPNGAVTPVAAGAVIPVYPRNDTTDRTWDLYRWAGHMWGIRGMESRKDYLYVGADGLLHDGRIENATYDKGITNLNNLYKEGLIMKDFEKLGNGKGTAGSDIRAQLISGSNNKGFLIYDYNQTTTSLNSKVEPILPAVADWEGNGKYFHFTESVRSVKTDAWAITAKTTGKELRKSLELFDYMYSVKGNQLMSFGPDEWLAKDNSGDVLMMDYGNEQIPVLGDTMMKIFYATAHGTNACTTGTDRNGDSNPWMNCGANANYTNFLRGWLGGTFPIGYQKHQGVEFQLTTANGRAGEAKIVNAVATGTMKQLKPTLGAGESPFYRLVPTTIPLNKADTDTVNDLLLLIGSFRQTSVVTDNNLFVTYISTGFGSGTSSPMGTGLTKAALQEYVKTTIKCEVVYLPIHQLGLTASDALKTKNFDDE